MKENSGKIDLGTGQTFEADHYDTYLNLKKPGYRTLCAHGELDPLLEGYNR